MLFQVLCGFEPIFYTTHPNEESFIIAIINNNIDQSKFLKYFTKSIFSVINPSTITAKEIITRIDCDA